MAFSEFDQASVGTLVSQLASDARAFAQAEVDVVKAKALEKVGRYRTAVIFFAVAGVLAFAALIAMLVGLIETIATVLGPGYATLIVVGATFALAAVLAFIGKGRLAPPAEIAS